MNQLIEKAQFLAIVTIFYNIAEGVISIFFGLQDETLALFGFGVDSFVEVISGIGILHMIIRMKLSKVEKRDGFERTALKITGYSFFVLAGGLILGSAYNIFYDIKPETTLIGIIVSVISIFTMYYLMNAKLKVGKELKSDAIIADANCTKTCFYLSFLLLLSSGMYELFQISYIDIAGSLGIAYFALKEGREALEKSVSETLACTCHD
ncbi:MAG: cation transporter [Ignavibacteriae bacterium]|nr:cation transporter [Ignavibacteriota bacterium]